MRAGTGPAGASSRRSMAASVASDSLKPSGPKNLMPLSAYGLCDAEMTAATSKPQRPSSSGAAGVGSTPPSSTSPPAAVTPADSAASSISPDSRVSRMIRTCGAWSERSSCVAARPRASASSAVRTSPATPRMPSVPKSLRLNDLALAELRPLAGLLQAGLLALLDTRVTRQETAALELATQVRVGVDQRAGDAVAQGAGLGADTAAVQAGHDVHALLVADGLERLADLALQRVAREEDVELLAVDRVDPGPRLEDHAGDRGLALAGCLVAGVGGEVDRRGDGRVLDDVGLFLGALVVGRGVLVVGVGIDRAVVGL